MWFSSSAGVNTSLSSMKSTSSAWSTSASIKCPIRTLAITGIVTVCIISRIIFMEAMRATPPSLRMSEGTRSSAITAQAPAFSAILACSALVTSIMTPPLSISARPTFTRHSFVFPLPFTFFGSILLLLSKLNMSAAISPPHFCLLLADHDKSAPAPSQHVALGISDFARQFRGHGAHLAEATDFSHGLIQERGDNSPVRHTSAALIAFSQDKTPHDPFVHVVLLERELHPGIVCAAAPKTLVRGVRLQPDRVPQISPASP